MPHNRLLVLVLNALSHQMLGSTASDLSQHEADLVLEQTGLSLSVFLGQQLAEHLDRLLCSLVPEHVSHAIFAEERNVIPEENS